MSIVKANEFQTATGGAPKVKGHSKVYGTVANALADTTAELGATFSCEDYASGNNAGVLFFKWVASGTGTPDGGSYFNHDTLSLQAEQNLPSEVSIKAFGGKSGDTSVDNALVINTMTSLGLSVFIPNGVWEIKTGISYTGTASISSYYTSRPSTNLPTVSIRGESTEHCVLQSNVNSFGVGDYIMQLNANVAESSDGYMFNISLQDFTIMGNSKSTSNQIGLKLRGCWHGSIVGVKVLECLDGVVIDGKGTPTTDDHDTTGFINFFNSHFINNREAGFKAIKSRPAGLNFQGCEFRNNGKFGYHGGGASLTFNECPFALNGSGEDEGGLYITQPDSDSVPRSFKITGCTFEANYNFEIWLGYIRSAEITSNVFTPFENASWTSTTKSIIKVLETGTTTNELRGIEITGNTIQNWATTGQPISWVRSNSNFGNLSNITDAHNNFAEGATIEGIIRYVFGSLDVTEWRVNTNNRVTLPVGATLPDITGGTTSFTSADSQITAVALYEDGNAYNATTSGTFDIIKTGWYFVSATLNISGLTGAHSGITFDFRVNSVQRSVVDRALPLDNGQRDVPFSHGAWLYLEQNDSLSYNCRISGSDTTAVGLEQDNTYNFSITSP